MTLIAPSGLRPSRARRALEALTSRAGVDLDGPRPWDIQVHDPRFYGRVLRHGRLGLGESYMDGWWDAERLDETFHRILRTDLRDALRARHLVIPWLTSLFVDRGRPAKAFEIGERHYDLGNDLYGAMLDRRMVYTCGYWNEAGTLDEAQEHKLELVCRKLGVRAGDRILDIGCGWGSFLRWAAEHHGATGVGITVSREQLHLATERLTGFPLEVRLQDYRALPEGEPFDHVVSLGMFEHVGHKNYRTFMRVVARHLKEDGLFLLHTIGGDRSTRATDPWIDRYIFPNSMLPSIRQIGQALEGVFVMEDWQNLSADYDRTLMAWHENFQGAWNELRRSYDKRFRRMWTYFLLSCAGLFRARAAQVWQIVLSKRGVAGGYARVG